MYTSSTNKITEMVRFSSLSRWSVAMRCDFFPVAILEFLTLLFFHLRLIASWHIFWNLHASYVGWVTWNTIDLYPPAISESTDHTNGPFS